MSHKPKFCPICYTDIGKCIVVREKQVTGVNEIIRCPKCKVIINCDESNVNIRCHKCNRLFADTIAFIGHLDKNCNLEYMSNYGQIYKKLTGVIYG